MQVSGSGPLGVLLMIAPLAAIPVFAILGVPHFAPVAASGTEDDDFVELGEPAARGPVVLTSEPARTGTPNELYAPVDSAESSPAAAPQQRVKGARTSLDRERRPLAAPPGSGRARGSDRSLPPSDALDQWEVRTDVADAGSSRDDEPVDSDAGTASDGFEGLEGTAKESDNGQVPAEDFNPDLLKPARAGLKNGQSNNGPSKSNRSRNAVDEPLEPPAERLRGSGTSGMMTRARGSESGRGPGAAADFAANAGALAQSLDEQSGWQDAARRLKKLGLRKYRLESRIDEQNFVFTCTLASPDNPQVVRRFEADADNPLEAVQQVLEQIDEWRSRNGGQAELTE